MQLTVSKEITKKDVLLLLIIALRMAKSLHVTAGTLVQCLWRFSSGCHAQRGVGALDDRSRPVFVRRHPTYYY